MEKIICFCKHVSEAEIKSAIAQGAKSLKDIQDATSGCTANSCEELNPKGICCSDDINQLLQAEKKKLISCGCCS